VIADPNASAIPVETPTEESPLSPRELHQLTLYKWRYSLEAYGFDTDQVRQLMFMKWLHASQRVQS
jgi:hypothetical protein